MTNPGWERIPEPHVHYCKLPDPKEFEVGDRIRCTGLLAVVEPPKAHRAKNYVKPIGFPCQNRFRLGLTWFWRDKVWRQE